MFCRDCLINQMKDVINHINFGEPLNNDLLTSSEIEEVKELLDKDAQFFFDSDPAATSIEEIKIAYPGYWAICIHRVAHLLYLKGEKLNARVMSEYGHESTGIDIHPGATIGCPFFIDHGTGVVIGQTSIVGDRVKIYQGVTLGALSPDKGQAIRDCKRHPTIGNDVVIYANASLIGDITIGDNVTIGGSVFLTESVAPNQRVIMDKPRIIYKDKK